MSGTQATRLPLLDRITWRPNRGQVARFAFSLLLAILLWGYVEQIQNPLLERQYPEVAITVEGVPESLQVVSQLPNATVTVKGAESELADVNRSSVRVSLDFSGVQGAGSYVVPVRVDVSGVDDVEVEPREVLINVEDRLTQVFPLTNDPQDDGDEARSIGTVSAEVSQVSVVGPSSAVARVDRVILPVTLDQQTSDFSAALNPVAVDSAGQQIAEVEISPSVVNATVEVRTRGKEVTILPTVVGDPADGFQVQQRRAVPDTVLVDGPPELLDDLLFLNTLSVDATDRSESFSLRTSLADLPEGVSVIDPGGGMIEVQVAIANTSQSSQTLSALPVEQIGLGNGLEVTFEPSIVAIQVAAPADTLQGMRSDDIAVLIDLTDLPAGSYTLTPQVTLPQGVTWLSNDPESIQVTITSPGSASPQASPIASPDTSTPSPIAASRQATWIALARVRSGHRHRTALSTTGADWFRT